MSDANLAVLAQIAEQAWSVLPPSPKFRKSRFIKDSLNYAKDTVVSAELRDDRQIPDILLVGFSSVGGYEFELSTQEFDLLLQNALFCTPTVVNITVANATCSASARTITTGHPGDFAAVLVGQRLMFSGTTGGALDGYVVLVEKVSTDTATLTVDGVPNYTGPATLAAKTYRNGVVRNSMALEKKLADTSYLLYEGCMNNTFKLTLEARKIATGTCDFIGKGAQSSSTSASQGGYNPQTTNPVLNCSNNVGKISQGGAPVNTGIKMMTVEVNNNLRPLPAIGQADLWGVGLGRCEVKGTMQMYFQDNTILDMFISHTKSSFGAVLNDGAGGALSVDIPSLQYDTGKTDVAGINTDVMLDTTYSAFRDKGYGFEIQICEMLAPTVTPAITTLTPSNATLGALPTVAIVIAGTNFLPSSIVLVNGNHVPSTFVSALEIDVVYTLPAIAGVVQFEVQDPIEDITSAPVSFTINAAMPTITALTPNTAPNGETGLGIVITGTNFLSTDVVQVDGITVPSTFVSASQISLTWNVPATTGTSAFTIHDPVNNVTSAASTFTRT